MKKIIPGLPLAVALALALGAAPALAQEVRIPHAQGETVLPAAPQKIAVFDLPTLDIVNALGKSDLVVAVPKSADGPANFPAHLMGFAEDRHAPAGTLFEPDAAALKALAPDLIVVGGRSAAQFEQMAAIALARTHELGGKAGTGLRLFGAGEGFSAQPPGSRFGGVYDLTGIEPAIGPSEAAPGPRPEPGTPEAAAARQRQQEALEAALAADPDWIFTIDRNAAVGNTEVAPLADRLAADERVTATSAWQEGRVVHLDTKIWYLMTGGIDGMTASAEAAAAAFAQAQ